MRNRYDLSAEVKKRLQGKKLRRRVLLPEILYSRRIEAEFKKALRTIIRDARSHVMDSLPEAVNQAADAGVLDGITYALDGLKRLLVQITPATLIRAAGLFDEEAARHTEQWIKGVKSATGVDLRGQIAKDDLAEEYSLRIRQNANLIKSLSDDVYARVERTVTDAVYGGQRFETVAKTLREQFGITDRRAQLIARDQMTKATSTLTQLRQEQAGVDRFVWSTMLDERVRGRPDGKYPKARPSHWAREGKTYSWSNLPDGEAPGMPVNCRCRARPVVDLD